MPNGKKPTLEERMEDYRRLYKEHPEWLGNIGRDLMFVILLMEEEITKLEDCIQALYEDMAGIDI